MATSVGAEVRSMSPLLLSAMPATLLPGAGVVAPVAGLAGLAGAPQAPLPGSLNSAAVAPHLPAFNTYQPIAHLFPTPPGLLYPTASEAIVPSGSPVSVHIQGLLRLLKAESLTIAQFAKLAPGTEMKREDALALYTRSLALISIAERQFHTLLTADGTNPILLMQRIQQHQAFEQLKLIQAGGAVYDPSPLLPRNFAANLAKQNEEEEQVHARSAEQRKALKTQENRAAKIQKSLAKAQLRELQRQALENMTEVPK